MLSILLALSSVTIGQPAPVEAAPILWNDLRFGMIKAEFKARYPKDSVLLTEGCAAWVYPSYEKKRMVSVRLAWNEYGGKRRDCGLLVDRSLAKKYGTPAKTERNPFLRDCPSSGQGGLVAAVNEVLCRNDAQSPKFDVVQHWLDGPVEITLQRREGIEEEFSVTYRIATMPSEEAASKL